MNKKEIEQYIDGIKTAKYSEQDIKVLSEYEKYSDVFLKRLWNKLYEVVYSRFEDYDPVDVFFINSISVSKGMPENTRVTTLDNDYYKFCVSKALSQNLKWEAKVQFGNIADFFYGIKFITDKYRLLITSDISDENIERCKTFVTKFDYICIVSSSLQNKTYGMTEVAKVQDTESQAIIYKP